MTYHCQLTHETFRDMAMQGERFSRYQVGSFGAWSAVEGYLAGLPDAGARIRFLRQEIRAVDEQIKGVRGDRSAAEGKRFTLGRYLERLREQLARLGASEDPGDDPVRFDLGAVEGETAYQQQHPGRCGRGVALVAQPNNRMFTRKDIWCL